MHTNDSPYKRGARHLSIRAANGGRIFFAWNGYQPSSARTAWSLNSVAPQASEAPATPSKAESQSFCFQPLSLLIILRRYKRACAVRAPASLAWWPAGISPGWPHGAGCAGWQARGLSARAPAGGRTRPHPTGRSRLRSHRRRPGAGPARARQRFRGATPARPLPRPGARDVRKRPRSSAPPRAPTRCPGKLPAQREVRSN